MSGRGIAGTGTEPWFAQFLDLQWVVGQVIAIAVAVIVLWFSSKGLRDEAARLRFLIKLVLDALEHAGLARVNRDEAGFSTSIVLSIKADPGKLTLEGQPPELSIDPVG
jgi:hypothetical protein